MENTKLQNKADALSKLISNQYKNEQEFFDWSKQNTVNEIEQEIYTIIDQLIQEIENLELENEKLNSKVEDLEDKIETLRDKLNDY